MKPPEEKPETVIVDGSILKVSRQDVCAAMAMSSACMAVNTTVKCFIGRNMVKSLFVGSLIAELNQSQMLAAVHMYLWLDSVRCRPHK